MLTVAPAVTRPPQDVTALVGSDVNFECGTTGDPAPHVNWRMQDGVLPAGRTRLTGDNRSGLRIERVSASDSGRYVCHVENSVGTATASALLTVLVPPTWDWSSNAVASGEGSNPPLSKEVRAHPGQIISLDCPVQGTPKPLVFWTREGSNSAMMASPTHPASPEASPEASRWSVLENGTLVIRNIRKDDASSLLCAAVNEAGSLVARTRLEVTTTSIPPPLVIEVGPANQTLPIKSPASLPCQAEDQPVQWMHDGVSVNTSARPRFSVAPDSGMLRIEELQVEDAGTYTCEVGHGDQYAAWTAVLSVANPTNPNVVFHRSPSDPMALPGSPSQPRLLQRTSTSLTISWQSGSRMGASPLQGYTVEVFSSAEDEPLQWQQQRSAQRSGWTWAGTSMPVKRAWRIVSRRLKADHFSLDELTPGTAYTFLVRAENGHGLSLPSPVSPWFSTAPSHGGHHIQWQSSTEVELVRQKLSAPLLRLDHARAVNSTAVRLTWQLLDGLELDIHGDPIIEGIYIWYRPVASGDASGDAGALRVSQPVNAASVSAFTVGNLVPFTRYWFFLVPFYRTIHGKPSNSKAERTLEAVPAAPPLQLNIRQLNATSVLVQWLPPSATFRNGNITAYQVSIHPFNNSVE